ncbi:MAG: hypothetical protein JWP28_2011 [Phenylobacterium sp.]|nr:hypothetical protein [Phenylobacterium sp.]
MWWARRSQFRYQLVRYTGITLLILALILLCALPRSDMRFYIVGVVGLIGAAVANASRNFKPND